MPGELDGRIALVTGGGSGIGRATSQILAREGAVVAVADLDLAAAAETTALVLKTGGCAERFPVDIADERSVAILMACVSTRFGGLDLAFNNAGIGSAGAGCAGQATQNIETSAWGRMIDINLSGLWHCMVHELRAMAAHGRGGAIVNNASIAAVRGIPNGSAYSASKHGVLGLTRSAAVEHAASGIRINAVCPGQIDTPLMADVLAGNPAVAASAIPAGRLGRPEEVGELVMWLLSERASFCTGAAFVIDGGQSAA